MWILYPWSHRGRARPVAPQRFTERRRDPRGAGRESVPLHRVREDHGRRTSGRRAHAGGGDVIIENATVVTMDGGRNEYVGYVAVEGNRITTTGPGPAPSDVDGRRIDATGCLVTPGLVNTHHHLYQWVT